MNSSWNWNDFLRNVLIAPAPKKRRKPRAHRYEPLEPRAMLTNYVASISGASNVPEGGVGGFTVSLSTTVSVGEYVVVGYALSGPAIDGDESYPTSGALTFSGRSTTAVVSIPSGSDNDSDVGVEESLTMALNSAQVYDNYAGDTAVAASGRVIYVTEGAGPGVAVSISPTEAEEGASFQASVTITGLTAPTVLTWSDSVSDESINPNENDLTNEVTKGSIDVATSGTYTITLLTHDDDTVESLPQSLTVSVNVAGVSATATAGIDELDNDNPNSSPTASLSVDSTSATEGQTLDFVVSYANLPLGNTIYLYTSPGTAAANTDYEPTLIPSSITVTSATGDVLVQVASIDDHAYEPAAATNPEYFYLDALDLNNYAYNAQGTGTITEDYDADDSEPTASIGDASVTEPSAGTTTMAFAVQLSNKIAATVAIPYYTVDGSASATEGDYVAQTTSVVIPAMQLSAFIDITVNADAYESTSPEDFWVSLGQPSAGVKLGTSSEGEGTIYQLPEPSVTIANSSAQETSGTMPFTLSLSATSNTQNIVVTYETEDGSATSGVDYTGTTDGTAVISSGHTTAIIAVPLLDDDKMVSNEPSSQQFSISLLSITANAVRLASNPTATGTITEDTDAGPTVFISNAAASEKANTMIFAVILSPPSAARVEVPWTTEPDTATAGVDFTPASGTVTFTPGTGSGATTQFIEVPIIDDTTLDDPPAVASSTSKNAKVTNKPEPMSDFTVNLTAPSNATLQWPSGTGYIYDGAIPASLGLNCVCTCSCPGTELGGSPQNRFLVLKTAPGDSASGNNASQPAQFRISQQRDPEEVVSVQDVLGSHVASGAKDIQVDLTFGTITENPIYYSAAGYSAGQTVDFAEEISSSLSAGIYNWTMNVVEEYSMSALDVTRTYNGSYDVENLDNSPFGAGWLFNGVDQLYPTTGGVELADDTGNMYYYASNGGGSFTSPADAPNFASLTASLSGTAVVSYSLTDAQGNVENFNSAGYLTDKVDTNGNTTSYDFSGNELTEIVEQDGQSISFSYGASSYTVTDVDGRATTYDLDTSHHVTAIISPAPGDGEAQLETTFNYNAAGHISTMVETNGATDYTWTYNYDPFGALTSVVDPEGHSTGYDAPQDQAFPTSGSGSEANPYSLVYDSAIKGAEVDGNGHTMTYGTGIDGQTTSSTDASGATTSTVYNAAGEPLEIIGPTLSTGPDAGVANVTAFAYDSYGNIVQEVLPDGASESWIYDVDVSGGTHFNEPISYTDPEGHVTQWTLDPTTGNVLSMTEVGVDSPNRVTQFTYTPKPTGSGQVPGGLLQTELDPRGIESSYAYNSHGLVTKVVQAANTTAPTTISFAYDSQDDLKSETDQDGRTTLFHIDGLGRTIETDSPPPNASSTSVYPISYATYDALDRLVSETDLVSEQPATVELVTDYTYETSGDDESPLVEQASTYGVTISAGVTSSTLYSATTSGYDAADNLASYIDGMGHTTEWQFNSVNEQIAEQDTNPAGGGNNGSFSYGTANGPLTSLVYDPLGNVVQSFDANQNRTDNAYDLLGDLVSTTGPAPTSGGTRPVTSYAFNHDQQITSETDPRGAVTQLFYNEFGELVKRVDPSPSAPGTANPAPSPVTTFQYDADGNLVGEVGPNGGQTQFIYNAFKPRQQHDQPG